MIMAIGSFIVSQWRAIAVLGLIAAGVWWVRDYGDERCTECTTAIVAKYEHALSSERAKVRELEEREAERSRAADRKWQEERNELQERISDLQSRHEPVRMCKPAAGGNAATAPTDAADQPYGATDESGHGLRVGRDIGDELVRYSGQCERYRRQLIEIQAWIAETYTP